MTELYEVIDGPGNWHAFKIGDIVEPSGKVAEFGPTAYTRVGVKFGIRQLLQPTQVRVFPLDLENK